jgi:dTDP-4-amino-4,6-dideoxygalactose transaminase
MEIPFFSLDRQHQPIRKQLDAAFDRIVLGGNFILGAEVDLFEQHYATYHKINYCTSVANGLDALFISLKALGIGEGDEVLVPSHTCFATWLAVSRAGATPVPVEVYPLRFTIDVTRIKAACTSRTKAIVPVHLYGHPCAMPDLMEIAANLNLFVVEDNAQAHGASINGKLTGSWGQLSATSFYPTKNLGALGDGGAILTNTQEFYDWTKSYRNYGSVVKDHHTLRGVNSRLDEMQAAILTIKLTQLNDWNKLRRDHAKLYFQQLKGVGDIVLPPMGNEDVQPVFHLFVIQTNYRDQLKNFLHPIGIGTGIHYPSPIHLQPAFEYLGYTKGSLPIAENLSQTVLSLPIWPTLRHEEVMLVCEQVKRFFESHL